MSVTQLVRGTQLKPGTVKTLVYNAATTGVMSDLAAITASKALASDSNGLPVASATTATELGYVSGVTSAIQAQINTLAYGLSWKQPALVATTAELTQAYTQTSATVLTETDVNGGVLQDIDGHTPVNADRILVKNELTTKAKNNGIYTVTNAGVAGVKATVVYDTVTFTAVKTGTAGNGITLVFTGVNTLDTVVNAWNSGNPSNTVGFTGQAGSYTPAAGTPTFASGANGTAWVLTRTADMDVWAEVPAASLIVETGTANADIAYVCTSDPGGTLGTTAITFVSFASINPAVAAGSDTQIQYNTGGAFDASSKLTFLATGPNAELAVTSSTNGAAIFRLTADTVNNQTPGIEFDHLNGDPIGSIIGYDNGDITLETDQSNNDYSWKFGANGSLTTPGNVVLSNQSAIVLKELTANGTDSVTLKAPASVTTSYTLQLPPAVGAAGTVLTDAAGDGVLSWASALTTTLADGDLFVGNVSNVATAVAMSGEATIINTGAVTLSNSAVIGKIITGYVSGAGTVADTDTILAAINKLNGNTAAKVAKAGDTMTGALTINPVSNQLVLGGVSAGFKVTISSTAPAADRTLTIPIATGDRNFLISGEAQIVAADISATAAIALTQLAAMTSGNIIVGSVGTVPTSVTMSADATIIASGALTIAASAITFAKTNQVILEKVNETPNGTLLVFSVDNALVSGSEMVFVNGVVQQKGSGNDYTVTKTTIPAEITFEAGNAPPTGSEVLVTYWKL